MDVLLIIGVRMTVNINKVHRPKVVAKMLNVSDSTIWRMVLQGKLKKPIKISSRAVGFPDNEIQAYLNQQIEERDNA